MRQLLIILLITSSTALIGQTTNKIHEIIQLEDDWKFEEAIEVIKSEIIIDPENSELYYWLARYSQCIEYNTRPFSDKSDLLLKEQMLNNLHKAVILNPHYGDSKYFIAMGYGARAEETLKIGDTGQYKKKLQTAKIWG